MSNTVEATTRLPITLLFLAVTSVLAQNSQESSDSRAWLNQGIQAYKNAHYQEAIAAFQKAADLNPRSVQARLYLGTAYMSVYIPGASSPDNAAYAARAESEFELVLQLDANNSIAIASLASLSYQQAQGIPDREEKLRKLDQARDWYQRLAGVDPNNREAYYSLGVIAWAHCDPARMAARAQLGMRPEDPGPLPNAAVRQDLKNRYEAMIEEGISNLERALQLDPTYDDAMAYMNLLVRERADLSDTPEQYRRDIATADEWVQKTLETRKRKAESGTPQRIRVSAKVQEHNPVSRVDPIYPPLARQARVQGNMRFTAVIGKDGRVMDLQLISGHPLLIEAATGAVRQWIYKPTLLNGEPVEVVAPVEVSVLMPSQ